MKVDRLVSIIMILLEKKRIGAQELADRFEVSPRTIYRDIDAINMAGIPVRSTSGVGGGFEIMPEYKMDKRVFTTAELSALLMGLTNLSGMVRGEELLSALAKVRSFIPADKAKEIDLKATQICIDLRPWMGNRNIQSNLETIQSALQESRLLSFAYVDGHGNQTERIVEPYQLVLKGSYWYFQGYCRFRQDYRLFRLSRISNLQMKAETFAPREYQKPILDYSEALEAMQTTIRLRIHKSILDRVLDFCGFENFTPDGAEHYLVEYPFIENDYYLDMLLSFGQACECLAPTRIREELKRRAQAIAAMYE